MSTIDGIFSSIDSVLQPIVGLADSATKAWNAVENKAAIINNIGYAAVGLIGGFALWQLGVLTCAATVAVGLGAGFIYDNSKSLQAIGAKIKEFSDSLFKNQDPKVIAAANGTLTMVSCATLIFLPKIALLLGIATVASSFRGHFTPAPKQPEPQKS